MKLFGRMALVLTLLFPLGAKTRAPTLVSTSDRQAQINFSPNGISHLLTAAANTLLADPTKWNPPQEAHSYSALNIIRENVEKNLSELNVDEKINQKKVQGKNLFKLGDVSFHNFDLGKIKFTYLPQDQGVKVCLPIKDLQIEANPSAGNISITNLLLKASSQDTYCYTAHFQETKTAEGENNLILQLDEPDFTNPDYNLKFQLGIWENDGDLLDATKECLRELQQCLEWGKDPRSFEESAEIASNNDTDPYLCDNGYRRSDDILSNKLTKGDSYLLDLYCAVANKDKSISDFSKFPQKDQEWLQKPAAAERLQACLDPLGKHYTQNNGDQFNASIEIEDDFTVTIDGTIQDQRDNPPCTLTSLLAGVNEVAQNTLLDNNLHELQVFLNQEIHQAINRFFANNNSFNSFIQKLIAPTTEEFGNIDIGEQIQKAGLRQYQKKLDHAFKDLEVAGDNLPDACSPHYRKGDTLAKANGETDYDYFIDHTRDYVAAVQSLLDGISPKIDDDYANEVLDVHKNKIEKLQGKIAACLNDAKQKYKNQIAPLTDELSKASEGIEELQKTLSALRTYNLEHPQDTYLDDAKLYLTNTVFPQLETSLADAGLPPNCPLDTDTVTPVSINVDQNSRNDLSITINYSAINHYLVALLEGKTVCIPYVEKPLEFETVKEKKIRFDTCYPDEGKMQCTFTYAPIIEYYEATQDAGSSLKLRIPILDCERGGKKVASITPNNTFTLDLNPQIIDQDGEPTLTLNLTANLGKIEDVQTKEIINLGILSDLFDSSINIFHAPILRGVGNHYLRNANEKLSDTFTEIPWIKLDHVSYDRNGLKITAKNQDDEPNYMLYQAFSSSFKRSEERKDFQQQGQTKTNSINF